jgi:hypothetical protein
MEMAAMNPDDTAQNVSNGKTPEEPPKPIAGGVLATRLREKGWSVRDAADYLGVSRQRLYAVFADPDRIRLWACAIAGMPACTPELKALVKQARQSRPKLAKPRYAAPVFAVGDHVAATGYAGIAEEGDEGTIEAIRGPADALELRVRMPGGEDWFPIADFNQVFMTNGKTRSPGI